MNLNELPVRELTYLNTAEALNLFWARVDHTQYFNADQMTHYEIVAGYLLQRFDRETPHYIADIGCGPGHMQAALRRYFPAARLVGMDYAQSAINMAQQLVPDAVFVRGDVTDCGLPDAAFDLVLCIECLEHIRDYDKALDEIWRILKPGGALVLTVPNGAIDKGAPYHVNFWTQTEIVDLLGQRGQVVHYQWMRGIMSTLAHVVKP